MPDSFTCLLHVLIYTYDYFYYANISFLYTNIFIYLILISYFYYPNIWVLDKFWQTLLIETLLKIYLKSVEQSDV